MSLFWLGIIVLCLAPIMVACLLIGIYIHVRWTLLGNLLRIFQEKPLFVIPRGDARAGAEEVQIRTRDGLTLRGCYLKTEHSRKGVILFGLEFGSNRWSCQAYCESLLQSGYDVFAFETRNQGDSDATNGYEPLQWLTSYEVADTQAAIAYLKRRPDADPKGVGFFGISKGGNAGLVTASRDRYIRCLVTDGAFATRTTMVPYMRKWVALYRKSKLLQSLLPNWFYSVIAMDGMRQVQRQRGVKFAGIERAVSRLKCPLLMIHGGGDTYIKVDMARDVFNRAIGPKVFWVVPNAKHNQAINIAGNEYISRVVGFFDQYLGGVERSPAAIEPLEDRLILAERALAMPA